MITLVMSALFAKAFASIPATFDGMVMAPPSPT